MSSFVELVVEVYASLLKLDVVVGIDDRRLDVCAAKESARSLLLADDDTDEDAPAIEEKPVLDPLANSVVSVGVVGTSVDVDEDAVAVPLVSVVIAVASDDDRTLPKRLVSVLSVTVAFCGVMIEVTETDRVLVDGASLVETVLPVEEVMLKDGTLVEEEVTTEVRTLPASCVSFDWIEVDRGVTSEMIDDVVLTTVLALVARTSVLTWDVEDVVWTTGIELVTSTDP